MSVRKNGRLLFYYLPPHPKKTVIIPKESRKLGVTIIAAKGSGKSTKIGGGPLFQDHNEGYGGGVFDPRGALIDSFLYKQWRLIEELKRQGTITPEEEVQIWSRIRYVDMSGENGRVSRFPLYHKRPDQSYADASEYLIRIFASLDPALIQAPIHGINALRRIALPSGVVMIALGLGVIDLIEMLSLPKQQFLRQWEPRLRKLRANTDSREVRRAVNFFLNEYVHLQNFERERLTASFLAKLSLLYDDTMEAMYGGSGEPSIDWEEVAAKRQLVLLDFRDVINYEKRRFMMTERFFSLNDYLPRRPLRAERPFVVYLDELGEYYGMDAMADNPVFGSAIVTLLDITSRNHNVWVTTLFKHPGQVDERSLQSLLSCGTVAIGVTPYYEHAEMLAKNFFAIDPYLIKRFNHAFLQTNGTVTTFRKGIFWDYTVSSPPVYERFENDPVEFSPEEQINMLAWRFKTLGVFQFLVKLPGQREGSLNGPVRLVDFTDHDRNMWFDRKVVDGLREWLSGLFQEPTEKVLAERDALSLGKPVVVQEAATYALEEPEAAPIEPAAAPGGELAEAALRAFDKAFEEAKNMPPEMWRLP